MGTTESVLIDSETDEAVDHRLSQPPRPLPSPSHASMRSPPPNLARMTQISPDREDPVFSSSPNHMVQRRRRPLPPPHPSPDPRGAALRPLQFGEPFLLSGLVLGLSKSGKRTLLQRLEGKEPDFSTSRTRNARGDVDSREEVTDISTEARYQVPPHLPAFDKVIQLQVHASKKLLDKTDGAFDFAVILIDPRHDRSKVQKFLTKRVRELLKLLVGGSDEQRLRRKPLCLTIVRNFRDMMQETDENSLISMSDLTMWTLEVLQDASTLLETEPLLQCIDTSLLNCYGLSALHHFIYQAYVQRKRFDLQPEWDRIGAAIEESKSKATALVVPYDDYLSSVERLLHASSQNSEATPSSSVVRRGRNDDETATTSASTGTPGGRRQIVLPNREEPTAARSRTQSGGSSSTLPSIQQSIDHAKDALEAFLESDDDENENYDNQNLKNESDDDDSEGDFYLDESGNGDPSSDAAEFVTQEMKPVGDIVVEPVPSNGHVDDPAPTTASSSNEQKNVSLESPVKPETTNTQHPVKDAVHEAGLTESHDDHDVDKKPLANGPLDGVLGANSSKNNDALNEQTNKVDDEANDPESESDSEFFIEEGDAAVSANGVKENQIALSQSDPSSEIATSEQIASAEAPSSVESTEKSPSATIIPRDDAEATPLAEATAHDTPPAPTSQISAEARAAIALAQQEFERLMRQEEEGDATAMDRPEKKKKKDKKSGSKKEKKSKQRE